MELKSNIEGTNHVSQTGDMQEEMNRINAKGGMAATPYEHSFGLLENKTEYMNPWNAGIDGKAIDERPMLRLRP